MMMLQTSLLLMKRFQRQPFRFYSTLYVSNVVTECYFVERNQNAFVCDFMFVFCTIILSKMGSPRKRTNLISQFRRLPESAIPVKVILLSQIRSFLN